MKKYDTMFSISLMVISLSNLVIACSNIFKFELPGIVLILLGFISLAAVPVLIYSSVKKKFGE